MDQEMSCHSFASTKTTILLIEPDLPERYGVLLRPGLQFFPGSQILRRLLRQPLLEQFTSPCRAFFPLLVGRQMHRQPTRRYVEPPSGMSSHGTTPVM